MTSLSRPFLLRTRQNRVESAWFPLPTVNEEDEIDKDIRVFVLSAPVCTHKSPRPTFITRPPLRHNYRQRFDHQCLIPFAHPYKGTGTSQPTNSQADLIRTTTEKPKQGRPYTPLELQNSMGNYTSCCVATHAKPEIDGTAAKLVDYKGRIRRVAVPVKAAELMLEEPGHAICPVNDIRRTGRVIAMGADNELLAGNLYMLVPLNRVRCKVSETERKVIDYCAYAASCGDRRSSKTQRSAKVLPAVPVELNEEGEGDRKVKFLAGQASYPSGSCKQWTPVLEPISEEF